MKNKSFLSMFFIKARAISRPLFLTRVLARRLFRYAKHELLISDYDQDIIMNIRLSEHMQRRIFWMGYCSGNIVLLLKEKLKLGMTFVDVGANVGEITLIAAKLVGKTGRVISFEPVTSTFEKLRENINLNRFEHVSLMKYGLGEESQDNIPIYSSSGNLSSDENCGLASLYNKSRSERPIDNISIRTMDDIVGSLGLASVDLIKVDIEGGEMSFLVGAEKLLRERCPMLIVEVQEYTSQQAGWNILQLFNYLEGFGYEFFDITKKGKLVRRDKYKKSKYANVFCQKI